FSLHNRLGPLDLIRGYNGSQIFDTTYATVDPAEPPHCASSNGISYWLAYQPPTNGLLTLDTLNSTYDTVMELYTYNGTLTGYSDLISLSCDDNSGGPGGAARLVTEVLPSRQYILVIQGVNGARGRATLNYSLNTNLSPQAPTLLAEPTPRAVSAGSDVTLGPTLTGTLPMKFSWKKNTTLMSDKTGP